MEENGRMEGQSRTIEWTARIVRWYRGPETKVKQGTSQNKFKARDVPLRVCLCVSLIVCARMHVH